MPKKKKIRMSDFVDETGRLVADDAKEEDVVGEVTTLYYRKLRSPKFRAQILKGLVRARSAAHERRYQEGFVEGPWAWCRRPPLVEDTRWAKALEILAQEIVRVTEWIYREPPAD